MDAPGQLPCWFDGLGPHWDGGNQAERRESQDIAPRQAAA